MSKNLILKSLAVGVAVLCGCLVLAACNNVEFALSVPCEHQAVADTRVEATCTEDGKTAGSHCGICGEVLDAQERIPATGHRFSEATCDAAKKCALCGIVEGIPTGHSFAEATCKEAKHCTVCNLVEGEKIDHVYEGENCKFCNGRKPSEGLVYSLNDDGKSFAVTGIGDFSGNSLVIPGVHDGLPVTVVNASVFANCNITELIILEGVQTIGTRTFENCMGLVTVSLPESMTSLGACAFQGCTALKSINLPNGLLSVGGWLFNGCSSLESVVIPNSVTAFGKSVFSSCTSLKQVTLSSATPSLGDYSFMNCAALTEIIVPGSVTSFGTYAFYGCTGLKTINYPKSKADWEAIAKGKNWNVNTADITVYCTDGDIEI